MYWKLLVEKQSWDYFPQVPKLSGGPDYQ